MVLGEVVTPGEAVTGTTPVAAVEGTGVPLTAPRSGVPETRGRDGETAAGCCALAKPRPRAAGGTTLTVPPPPPDVLDAVVLLLLSSAPLAPTLPPAHRNTPLAKWKINSTMKKMVSKRILTI